MLWWIVPPWLWVSNLKLMHAGVSTMVPLFNWHLSKSETFVIMSRFPDIFRTYSKLSLGKRWVYWGSLGTHDSWMVETSLRHQKLGQKDRGSRQTEVSSNAKFRSRIQPQLHFFKFSIKICSGIDIHWHLFPFVSAGENNTQARTPDSGTVGPIFNSRCHIQDLC